MSKIPFPCTANISDMEKGDGCFTCSSCDHKVYDFRSASNAEIQQVCNTKEGRVCGVLNASNVEEQRFNWRFLIVVVAVMGTSLFSLTTAEAAAVQSTIEGNVAFESTQNDSVLIGHISSKETGEDMPFCTVLIEGTGIGAFSDMDGNFQLKFNNTVNGDFILLVQMIGYKDLKIPLNSNKLPVSIQIKMSEEAQIMVGIIIDTEMQIREKDIDRIDGKTIDDDYF